MNNQKQQKPTLTGQRFKTRKRGECWFLDPLIPSPAVPHSAFISESTFVCRCLPTDEKERFDPTQFQESIVQGLNQTGTDLEAVAKFLDASGAKLDYRRYAETLFDILVAGGMLGELRHVLSSLVCRNVCTTCIYLPFYVCLQPQEGLSLMTWPAQSTASSRHKKTWRQCKHMLRSVPVNECVLKMKHAWQAGNAHRPFLLFDS